jgi:hypothetical protein
MNALKRLLTSDKNTIVYHLPSSVSKGDCSTRVLGPRRDYPDVCHEKPKKDGYRKSNSVQITTNKRCYLPIPPRRVPAVKHVHVLRTNQQTLPHLRNRY